MRGGSMTYRAIGKTRWSELFALSCILATACSKGSIGDPEKSILPPGPGGYNGPNAQTPTVIDPVTGLPVTVLPDGGIAGGPGGPGSPQLLNCDPAKITPGPSFVRRLNRFEYNNT